jgi:uncharacterized protein (TIGR01777 family)
MTIVIAGGSGFLGQKLARRISRGGHQVRILTRRQAQAPDQITWQPDGTAGSLPAHLNGVDAVVNLAGENIASRRWSAAQKELLRSSRILPTRTLARAIAQCDTPPKTFVSASGVGYYGPHGDAPVTEETPPGSDFFGRLCVDWEQEARAVPPATRLTTVRSSPALDKDGGALKKMLWPFKLGLGATLGSGEQFFPWIHADDWTAMVMWMIENDRATGAFNAAAPTPVTNREFTQTLARVLKRPAIFHAPAFALRAALGELADVLLTGQRAVPAHAEQLGFRFTHRTLEPALHSLQLR